MKTDKATNRYKGYPIAQNDRTDGVVLDTARPPQAPYEGNRQIGPTSKTGFGYKERK